MHVTRFSGVDEWMNCVKSLMDKMSQECISSDEYRSFLQKFQVTSVLVI